MRTYFLIGVVATLAGVGLIVVGLATGPAAAVSTNEDNQKTSFLICTDDTPDPLIDVQDVRDDIQAIDDKWETVPSVYSEIGPVIISLHACDGHQDYTVTWETLLDANGDPVCCARTGASTIKFHDMVDWCIESAVGGQANCDENDELSFKGFLLHEMGHALGAEHSGGCEWNNGKSPCDGDDDPTMSALAADSYEYKSLQKDDKSIVPWMENDVPEWWSFDPGWELAALGVWYTTGSVTISSTTPRTGENSVVLGPLASVAIDTVYDPWEDQPPGSLLDGMVTKPQPEVTTAYRESGDKGGGVNVRYKYKLIDYDTTGPKNGATPAVSWSIPLTPVVQNPCNLSDSSWEYCGDHIGAGVQLSTDGQANVSNNAVVFRAKFNSKTQNSLRLDETGLRDW